MGEPVLIYGKSGSGKSRSLKNFADDEIYYVNVGDKSLPFRKKFKYTTVSDDTTLIKAGLKKMPVKTAVIDDSGFIMDNQYMDEHSKEKKGNDVYKMYDDIADNFFGLIKFIKSDLPKDVIVYLIMHEDTDDFGNVENKVTEKIYDDISSNGQYLRDYLNTINAPVYNLSIIQSQAPNFKDASKLLEKGV